MDPQKCKVLLHLGNSVAFFVDNVRSLSYLFVTGTPWLSIKGAVLLPASTCGISNGLSPQERVCFGAGNCSVP